MAFVRRRTTKAGGVSTTLLEAYRDQTGKPRQRVLANLHAAETLLEALAKLAAQRERLRKEKAELAPELEGAARFYETFTTAVLNRRKYSAAERKEIDRLMRARNRLLKRAKKVDADLARIQKDGAVIRKHCDASPDEVQAAIRKYKKELANAEALVLGTEFYADHGKREFRRLSL